MDFKKLEEAGSGGKPSFIGDSAVLEEVQHFFWGGWALGRNAIGAS